MSTQHLVFFAYRPAVKSYHKVWQRKLAALVSALDECLLTRDEINDLASFLKARGEELTPVADVRQPDWVAYERYGSGPAILIGGDLAMTFRGVNPIPGGRLSNYLADLDIDKIYKTVSK